MEKREKGLSKREKGKEGARAIKLKGQINNEWEKCEVRKDK